LRRFNLASRPSVITPSNARDEGMRRGDYISQEKF
jgi:hypothetical protein